MKWIEHRGEESWLNKWQLKLKKNPEIKWKQLNGMQWHEVQWSGPNLAKKILLIELARFHFLSWNTSGTRSPRTATCTSGHSSSMKALSDFLSNFAEWVEETHFSVFSSSISFYTNCQWKTFQEITLLWITLLLHEIKHKGKCWSW